MLSPSASQRCVTALPEATYLAWLDARGLDLGVSPAEHFLDAGRLAVRDGAAFGEAGEGFVRVNLATSRPILEQIVDRMVSCAPPRDALAAQGSDRSPLRPTVTRSRPSHRSPCG